MKKKKSSQAERARENWQTYALSILTRFDVIFLESGHLEKWTNELFDLVLYTWL